MEKEKPSNAEELQPEGVENICLGCPHRTRIVLDMLLCKFYTVNGMVWRSKNNNCVVAKRGKSAPKEETKKKKINPIKQSKRGR